ncbi:MAG: hypothetical protein ACOY3I_06090 [Verrucomicrobiota bacterium]
MQIVLTKEEFDAKHSSSSLIEAVFDDFGEEFEAHGGGLEIGAEEGVDFVRQHGADECESGADGVIK